MPTSIRRMTTTDVDRAATVLGDAFADYPWTNWCIAADSHHQRVTELQRLYLGHMALPHGLAYIDEEHNGVVAFIPPDLPEPEESLVAKIVELHGDRFEHAAEAEQRLSAMDVPDNAWCLATAGVSRAARGRGLGSELLTVGLAELDRRNAACWLDTSTHRNLPLYERHNFRVADHVVLDDALEVWRMHRPAV
ncbi:GNAT family N-acetyltransferase [Rhodococcus sp. USK13]|nr:GNAT family N-acetyltransferase [Rhodococcus sp. USK13]